MLPTNKPAYNLTYVINHITTTKVFLTVNVTERSKVWCGAFTIDDPATVTTGFVQKEGKDMLRILLFLSF